MSSNSAGPSTTESGSGSAESAVPGISIDVDFEPASSASPSVSSAGVHDEFELSEDLRNLLTSTGLMKYENICIANEILSIDDILLATEDDLLKFGIKTIPARKLLTAASQTRTLSISTSSPASPSSSSSSSSPSKLSLVAPSSPLHVVIGAAAASFAAAPSAAVAPDRSVYNNTLEIVGDGKRNYVYDNVGDLLGSGGFGSVYKCAIEGTPEQKNYAVKIIPKRLFGGGSNNSSAVENEISLLSTLSESGHENIVQLLDAGSSLQKYWIVMEYIVGNNLTTTVQNKQQALAIEEIFSQLCNALHYLHRVKGGLLGLMMQ